jgi:hypothetical protein
MTTELAALRAELEAAQRELARMKGSYELMTDQERKLMMQFGVSVVLAERIPDDFEYRREGKSEEEGILIRLGQATVKAWPRLMAELAARHQEVRRLRAALVETWDAITSTGTAGTFDHVLGKHRDTIGQARIDLETWAEVERADLEARGQKREE